MKVGDLVQTKSNDVVPHHVGIIVNEHHPWANPEGLGDNGLIEIVWDNGTVRWTSRTSVEVISEG